MSADIFSMLQFEEGWSSTPYICSEGYPTIGYGFKLGPKVSSPNDLRLYQFFLPRAAGDAWLSYFLDDLYAQMEKHAVLGPLIQAMQLTGVDPYDNARICVLLSMAYQMGIIGLAGFVNTLKFMSAGDWYSAAHGMMQSKWATQSPKRAMRQSEQIRTGQWQPEYQK